MRLLVVAAALMIAPDRRVLLAQRPPGKAMAGLWEFPGGKLEPGETPEAALARELDEEVGVTVSPGDFVPFRFASHSYDAFHLLMPLYAVRRWTGEPQARDVAAVAFVHPDDLDPAQMPPADEPLVEAVQRAFRLDEL